MNIPLIKSFIPYLVASLDFYKESYRDKIMTIFKSLDSPAKLLSKNYKGSFRGIHLIRKCILVQSKKLCPSIK